MPITLAPFTLKDTSLTLIKTSDIGTGTEVEYRCQLTQAQLTPSSAAGGGGNQLQTFCDTFSSEGTGNATWSLDLSGFQAFADVQDLSILLFQDEGESYTYTLTPVGGGAVGPSNPGFTGECTLTPTQIGGTAQQYATFQVSIPCSGKPTMVTA